VARRRLILARRIAKLGPKYANCPVDCEVCKRDEGRERPKCEYTIQRKIWEAETLKELKAGRTSPEEDIKWPLKHLEQSLGTVSFASSGRKAGHHPKWSIVTAYLVDIYRDEVSKLEAIDAWRRRQDAKDAAQAAKEGRPFHPRDEDEED
jgi:hypothetical protein